MRFLRQSTSVDVPIGPFLDSTDGVTAETALTITQPDVRLKKNGGNWAQKAAAQTLSHEENGYYEVTLDATDTDTVGLLRLAVAESGALPIWEDFQVLEEAIYDALFAASANAFSGAAGSTTLTALAAGSITAAVVATGAIDADAIADNAIDAGAIAADAITAAKVAADVSAEIADAIWDEARSGHVSAGSFGEYVLADAVRVSGDATAADNLETALDDTAGAVPWVGIVDQGTAQSATATTVVLRAAAAFADDTLIGAAIAVFGSTQGYWQVREITDNVSSTDTVTVDAWTVTPSGTITYKIFGVPPALAALPTVNVTQISGDSTAADNLEAAYDGSGYAHTGNTYPWTAAWDAEVQSEVQDAIEANHLDHLIAVADPGGVVANSSFLAKLVSKSATPAFSSYDNTTDSHEALRDRGDAAWVTATGFSTHSAADVWAASTRTLTAGTNINGSTFTAIPWNASWDAEVQSEVADALAVDTYGEPTGVPGATVTLAEKIGRLYQGLRNKITVTSSAKTFYSDSDVAIWKKVLSDDGTTYTEAEAVAP